LLPNYQGARPHADPFVPYDGEIERIEAPVDRKQVHAFRRTMLLNGVDLFGLSGMTTAAHTEEDVDRTVAAVAESVRDLGKG
jgi:glutamate-1-semialdehyde 2,1-aminomutase